MNSKVPLLANDYMVVFESPFPDGAFCYTPGLVRLDSGRLVATMDLGGLRVPELNPPVKLENSERGGFTSVGKIFTSDDGGQTWTHRADFPGIHARPFVMIDWRMAGVVAQGNSAKESRHYASMTFDGDDLLVLSRSGDERAKSAHDGFSKNK